MNYTWCIGFLLLKIALLLSEEPVAVYLTFQQSPHAAMTLQWITPLAEAKGSVQFKSADAKLWDLAYSSFQPLPNEMPYGLHRLELTGLKPDSEYIFRIGNEKKEYKFLTLPDKLTAPITFVEGGDVYHDGRELYEKINRLAASKSPRFVLWGGDLAYASNRYFLSWEKGNRWIELLSGWSETMITPDGHLIPILVALGNHDVTGRFDETPDKAPFFYTLFPTPGYQVVDVGDYLSIFILDSGHTHPIEGKQTEWLEEQLARRSSVPLKFACYHVPAFPSVRSYTNKRSSVVRQNWPPLFEKHKVIAAFEHHEHAYKRTHPILKTKASSNGVVYFGDGCWGVEKVRKPRPSSRSWYLAKTSDERHFIMVTLFPEKVHYQAINDAGAVIDEYSQNIIGK